MTNQLELIPLTVTDTHPHSYYFMDNVFNDEEIRFIINSVELNNSRFEEGKVGGATDSSGYNPEVRRSKVGWLDPNDRSMQFFFTRIIEAFKKINQDHFRYMLYGLENTQFTKYSSDETGHYNWHADEEFTGFKQGYIRKLSTSILLSDPNDYEGGELQICETPDNIVNVEARKGRMVFFPSHSMHRVAPVTKGVRYSAVTWARGPAFV